MPTGAEPLFSALLGAGRVLLTGPVKTDGDSLGACLALQSMLVDKGVRCDVTGTASYRYAWMPGIEGLLPDAGLAAYDAVVVLDGDRHRLPPVATERFAAAPVRAIIDHHASTKNDGYTHFWVDPVIGSTCEMLYGWFVAHDVLITPDLARLLYTGLVFDTGGFRYSNTTPASHHMAAALLELGVDHDQICLNVLMDRRVSGLRAAADVLQAASLHREGTLMVGGAPTSLQAQHGTVDGDLEGLVETLLQVRGVEVAVLVIQTGPGTVTLSFRSRGSVDVSALAHGLHPSGGGHKKAAGVRLNRPYDEVLADVRALSW